MRELFGYRFENEDLLEEALTTPAYRMDVPDAKDNQRLEFLGDAVLGMLSAERLFGEFPKEQEGALTVRRTHMVSAAALCAAADSLGLAAHLKRNRGAAELPRNSKTLADAIEAIVGAVYLDGGFAAAKKVFETLALSANAAEDEWSGNPKGELQVRAQAMKPPRHPEYELLKTEGRAHEPVFTVRVTVAGMGSATASARSHKQAESLAAAELLASLSEVRSPSPAARQAKEMQTGRTMNLKAIFLAALALATGALPVRSELAAGLRRSEGRVVLQPGVNRLERPIVLGPDDSGTVICGASDGTSVLSGAVELKGLSFERGADGVWSSSCDVDAIDQLFVGGVRYAMARFPNRTDGKNVFDAWSLNDGRYRPEMDALRPERVRKWSHPETGYLHAMHAALWGDMHWKIEGRDEKGALRLAGGWQNNRATGPHGVFRFVENIREELDQPGEWFYDRAAKRLFVIPLPGTDLRTARLESVRLRALVVVRGEPGRPVRNVRIENVAFTGAARTFMENREPLLRSDWTLCREAAVMFANTEGCVLDGCTFRQLGGNAVLFDGFNRNASVSRTSFAEIGASGVIFAGRPDAVRNALFSYGDVPDYAKLDRTPGPKSENYPRDCRVEDCRFVRTGRDEKQTAAVQITVASRISVLRCFIRKTPRAAINIGDGSFGGHLIEGCDVAETVLETGDHGAFNSWGRDRYWQSDIGRFEREVAKDPALPFLDALEPTVIRGNRWRCDHGWDVDLDDGSSNYVIEDNDFLSGGLKLREGYRRIVRRNRAANNSLHRHCWPAGCGDVVVSNVFARPFFDIRLRCSEGDVTIRDNVFLRAAKGGGEKPSVAWGTGRVREFDGPREFSAFGVVPETVGVVVIVPPGGTPFRAGDLLVDRTERTLPRLPLVEAVRLYRNQQLVTVRAASDAP